MSNTFDTTLAIAKQLDAQDELAHFKQQFHFPKHNNQPVIYFCGNSLGLQPVNVEAAVLQELSDWKNLAISGFSKAKNPWLVYQEYLKPSLANIVGCKENEVTVMEAGAFPSDQYAVETLAKHFQLNPEDVIIEISPRAGEKLLHTDDIITAINDNADSLAMVMFGGINYYTGQLFNMQQITKAAHEVGAIAGFDLAHVVGNVPLHLHNWQVDFACWCSYKYLNGGPGAVGGIYVHEKFAENTDTPRLAGWWGNDEVTRFKMEKGFIAKPNASGWNISTAQVLNTVALKASLEMFDAADIGKIRTKSLQLTAYLAYLLQQLQTIQFEIITPINPEERGAQLSLYFNVNGKAIHQKMMDNGIVVDYREPGVIRVAPAPLYCGFQDVYRFYEILRDNF
jgi:kynureninase